MSASPSQAPAPRRPSRWLIALAVAVLLAAVAFVIFGVALAERPVPDQLQGMVDTDTLDVTTKVPSRITRLLAHEGDTVKLGQVLAVMSSPEVQAKSQEAQGALNGARALLSRAVDGSRVEDTRSLEAVWRSAQSAADLAAVTARRADVLFSQGVIAAQRRDEADAAHASAVQNADAAHEQYLKALHGSRPEDKRLAVSQVQVAQAGLSEAQSLQAETRLVAPSDGEISKRFASDGELVLAGVPVFTMIDPNRLWVSVNLREDQFHGLRMGQIIRGDLPAMDRKAVAFKVFYISPQGDFATWRATRQSRGYDVRSFEVRARPLISVSGLRPGMSVLFGWPPS
ncbi:MAG: HlyD family secretion protein [Caulobacteraceae bacterium]